MACARGIVTFSAFDGILSGVAGTVCTFSTKYKMKKTKMINPTTTQPQPQPNQLSPKLQPDAHEKTLNLSMFSCFYFCVALLSTSWEQKEMSSALGRAPANFTTVPSALMP